MFIAYTATFIRLLLEEKCEPIKTLFEMGREGKKKPEKRMK